MDKNSSTHISTGLIDVLADKTSAMTNLTNGKDGGQYSLKEVSNHCDTGSCWIIVENKVYDITHFLQLHPGGLEILLEHAGMDATAAFTDKGHSGVAYKMLQDYFIGEVIGK